MAFVTGAACPGPRPVDRSDTSGRPEGRLYDDSANSKRLGAVHRVRPDAVGGILIALVMLAACSPEAVRTRDGGQGADPGNTPRLATETPRANPQAADTSLWPGKAMAPVDRLARGDTLPHS